MMDVDRDTVRRDGRNGSALDALRDVVQSSQEVVLRRLDVLRLELERRLETMRDEAVGLALAALFGITAWVLVVGAGVVFLTREIGLGWALALVGAVNLLLAVMVPYSARRKARETNGGDEP